MYNRLKSIKFKLLLSLIPGTIIALSLTLMVMLFLAEKQFASKLEEKKNSLNSYAELLGDPLWNFNTERVDKILSTILLDQDIVKVAIYDEGGNLLSERTSNLVAATITSEHRFAITYSNAHINQNIGTFSISLGDHSLQKERLDYVFSGLFSLFLIVISLAIGVWLIFSKLLDKPLRALIAAINTSRDGSFEQVNYRSEDELGVISEAFNQMQSSLQQQHKSMVEAKDHLKLLYHSTPALLFSFDSEGTIRDASDYFLEQLDYQLKDIIGRKIDDLLAANPECERVGCLVEELWQQQLLVEYPLRIKDGKGRQVEVLMDATLSASHSFPGALAVFTDVTSLNQARRKLENLANTDQLSGIANRHYFQSYLEQLTEDRRRSEQPFALLFIDLDHFKAVNDTYGHHVGDELLRLVTERIKSVLRNEDKIARLGGDEFAVILDHLPSPEFAANIAQRIIDKLSHSFVLEHSNIYISASIGMAMYPSDSQAPATLLQYADLAMYRAKEDGRSQLAIYSDEQNQLLQNKLRIEALLRTAVEMQRLDIHYQPIISLEQGTIIGFEALLRLRDDDGQLISPGEFIPIAEESGLIVHIGQWCIEQSCLQLAAWKQSINPNLYLSVNVSTRQFQSQSFYSGLASAIEQAAIAPQDLLIEITESLLLHDNHNNLSIFSDLKQLGCQIAIDDFGTGFSALSYLTKFPLNTLKIDRSFICHHAEANLKNGLVTAIVQMAHCLDLKVIVEGVETSEQLRMLQQISQQIAIQGFYFSRPLEASAIDASFQQLCDSATQLQSARALQRGIA